MKMVAMVAFFPVAFLDISSFVNISKHEYQCESVEQGVNNPFPLDHLAFHKINYLYLLHVFRKQSKSLTLIKLITQTNRFQHVDITCL